MGGGHHLPSDGWLHSLIPLSASIADTLNPSFVWLLPASLLIQGPHNPQQGSPLNEIHVVLTGP